MSVVEVLTLPFKVGDRRLDSQYDAFFRDTENITVVPLSEAIAIRAASLRAEHELRTPDAIVAASALALNCEALITNDERLKRLTGLKVLYVSDYT